MTSVVLSSDGTTGASFSAVVFSSSQQAATAFENLSLVWYSAESPSELCNIELMKASATEATQALVFSKSFELVCFPEKIAQVAKAKGFSALIWQTSYSSPGYFAKAVWGSNAAPIPIFEVSSRSQAFQLSSISRVRIIPEANPLEGMSWFGPQIPLLMTIVALSLVRIVICARAFFPTQMRLIMATKELTTAQIVLISTIISGVLNCIHCADFLGQAHLLPLPVWFMAFIGGFLFNALSTFVLAKAMLSAEATVRGLTFERSRLLLLNISFGLFFLVSLLAAVLIGWDAFYSDTVMVALNVSFIIFQVIVGIHFLRSKKRVLNLLHASISIKIMCPLKN
eukprot:TRINITY_DN22312_c0_g1_i1.p1 TRINITY_DN22312_c0_g1~~TRINITY_DN22312_c0_g1_i1.p1  ORF type:complete len:340 (-),score=67.22 TRINITY_DN22312_c0_g1_i1:484-1503(-)